jgi:hypothetical protein
MVMADGLRKQIIVCPDRNREVEVTYSVSGNWFSPNYEVIACPAMYDSEMGCDRRCTARLADSASNLRFLQKRA